jgi:hypothetical protein
MYAVNYSYQQQQKKKSILQQIAFFLRQDKNKKYTIFGIFFLLICYLLLFQKSLTFFITITILSAVFNYILHITGIHIHFGHVSFFNVLFSYKLGFWYGFIFIILTHVIPEVLSGHMDIEMFLSFGIYTVVSFLASMLIFSSFLPLAISLLILQTTASFILGGLMGTPFLELITEHGTEHVFVMLWYYKFSGIILLLL